MEPPAGFLAAGIGITTAITLWGLLGHPQRRFALSRASDRLRHLRGSQGPGSARLYRHDVRYSYLPTLQHLLKQLAFTPRLLGFLEQAGSSMNVSSYLLLHACCATASGLIVFWLHLPLLFGGAVVTSISALPWIILAAKRRQRLNRLTEQLPEATQMIASAMRAGLGLETGLHLVAIELPDPIRGEFQRALNEQRVSTDSQTAFQGLAARTPTDDFRLFAACICFHREVGGNFAQTLDQLGQTIRDRFRLWRELKTLTAEGRLSGWILQALPLVVLVVIALQNPGYLQPLFEHPGGRALLWACVLLQLLGWWTIRWLTTPRIR